MQQKNNRFKKIKIKKEKERKEKISQTCKSPMQRQGFIYTIKKVTEEKRKKKLKSLIRFHSANKIDNYNRVGKKKKTNPKESTEQVKA